MWESRGPNFRKFATVLVQRTQRTILADGRLQSIFLDPVFRLLSAGALSALTRRTKDELFFLAKTSPRAIPLNILALKSFSFSVALTRSMDAII